MGCHSSKEKLRSLTVEGKSQLHPLNLKKNNWGGESKSPLPTLCPTVFLSFAPTCDRERELKQILFDKETQSQPPTRQAIGASIDSCCLEQLWRECWVNNLKFFPPAVHKPFNIKRKTKVLCSYTDGQPLTKTIIDFYLLLQEQANGI